MWLCFSNNGPGWSPFWVSHCGFLKNSNISSVISTSFSSILCQNYHSQLLKDVYGFSFGSCSCSPSDPVDILFAFPGNIVIIDVGNTRISSLCSHIRANKDTEFSGMESLHYIISFVLGQTTMVARASIPENIRFFVTLSVFLSYCRKP